MMRFRTPTPKLRLFFEYHTKRSISLAFHVCLIEAENVRFHLCICSLSMALVFSVKGVDHLYQKRINWKQIATTDIDKIVWMVGRNKRRLRSLTDFIERFCLVYRVFHAMFVFHDHHSEFQIDWILFYRFKKWIVFFSYKGMFHYPHSLNLKKLSMMVVLRRIFKDSNSGVIMDFVVVLCILCKNDRKLELRLEV